jgi:hypothetical protein
MEKLYPTYFDSMREVTQKAAAAMFAAGGVLPRAEVTPIRGVKRKKAPGQ